MTLLAMDERRRSRQLHTYTTVEQYEALRALSEHTRIPISVHVRAAIDAYLKLAGPAAVAMPSVETRPPSVSPDERASVAGSAPSEAP